MANIINIKQERKGKVWPKLRPFLIALVIIVLTGAAGLGLRWLLDSQKTADTPAVATQKAQNQVVSGDFNGAHATIDNALKTANLSDQEKYSLYSSQAAAYYSEKKYQPALDNYKLAVAIKATQEMYNNMARLAEQLGDKTSAIDYYKKAIALIPKDNPVGGADKDAYEARIKALGGTP